MRNKGDGMLIEKIFVHFMCMCVWVYGVYCVHVGANECPSKEGIRLPGTGIGAGN